METAIIALVALLGVVTQRVLGFGIAVFLTPVALFFFDPATAIITTLSVGTLSCAIIVFKSRRHSLVIWPMIWRLLIPAIPGLLLGAYIVTRIDKGWLQIILGFVVIAGVLIQEYAFPKPTKPLGVTRGISLSGLLTGLLNAAAGNGAPALVLWMRLHASRPEQIRQNIAALFVMMDICSLVSIHTLQPRSFTSRGLGIFLLLIPIIFLANNVGTRLAKRVNAKQYEQLVVVTVIITGLVSIGLGVARHL